MFISFFDSYHQILSTNPIQVNFLFDRYYHFLSTNPVQVDFFFRHLIQNNLVQVDSFFQHLSQVKISTCYCNKLFLQVRLDFHLILLSQVLKK